MSIADAAIASGAVMGGAGLLALGLRKPLTTLIWQRPVLRCSLEIRPSPEKPPAWQPRLNSPKAPPRPAERRAEPSAATPVPPDGTVTRGEAAARLGTSERTLRRHPERWPDLEYVVRPGRATLVTAASLEIQVANGSTS